MASTFWLPWHQESATTGWRPYDCAWTYIALPLNWGCPPLSLARPLQVWLPAPLMTLKLGQGLLPAPLPQLLLLVPREKPRSSWLENGTLAKRRTGMSGAIIQMLTRATWARCSALKSSRRMWILWTVLHPPVAAQLQVWIVTSVTVWGAWSSVSFHNYRSFVALELTAVEVVWSSDYEWRQLIQNWFLSFCLIRHTTFWATWVSYGSM